MNITETFRRRFDNFSASMDFSPNRDRAIYSCTHAALVLVAAIFVLAGFTVAVWPAVVLSLALTGQSYWQCRLSRRSALAGFFLLAIYIVYLLVTLFSAELPGFVDIFFAVTTLLLVAGALILWYWAANCLYNADFRLPREDSGPW